MRTIKFRGKDKETGQWKHGSLFVSDKGVCCISPAENMHTGSVVAPETVGQYIGIKDSNDKEIYEGDIVRETAPFEGEYITEYDEENACFKFYSLRANDYITAIDFMAAFEVIGNAFDNHELLKEGGAL